MTVIVAGVAASALSIAKVKSPRVCTFLWNTPSRSRGWEKRGLRPICLLGQPRLIRILDSGTDPFKLAGQLLYIGATIKGTRRSLRSSQHLILEINNWLYNNAQRAVEHVVSDNGHKIKSTKARHQSGARYSVSQGRLLKSGIRRRTQENNSRCQSRRTHGNNHASETRSV